MGRPRRTERISQGQLLAATDTEYFGLNKRVIEHVRTDGTGDANDRVTAYYYDAHGNLRLVDTDEGAVSPQGVDAIYRYDYANRLIKANLVPQIHPAPSAADRFAVSDGDHQVRTREYDALGRLVREQNPESGAKNYRTYNNRGQLLVWDDENGRSGGGPGGGAFAEVTPPAPACTADDEPPYNPRCDPPNLLIHELLAKYGRLNAQWACTGSRLNILPVPPPEMYYRLTLLSGTGSEVLANWTQGLVTFEREGMAAGDYTLRIECAVRVDAGPADVTSANQPFTMTDTFDDYRLANRYDGRGRLTAILKKTTGVIEPGVLRQVGHERQDLITPCAESSSCGRETVAIANHPGIGQIAAFTEFRPADGRPSRRTIRAPRLSGAESNWNVEFADDELGRRAELRYPDAGGAATRRIRYAYRHGEIDRIERLDASGTAELLFGPGLNRSVVDYHPDGSLAYLGQGNQITLRRDLDGAERTGLLQYSNIVPCPPEIHGCHGLTEQGVWTTDAFGYDGLGNIAAIGADLFGYDRLGRLSAATVNRHPWIKSYFTGGVPHIDPQPEGSVSVAYDYDAFGNITKRKQTAATNYRIGSRPLEQFEARDYTHGLATVPDNQIHADSFLYDGNGNLVSDGIRDYIYDELNQQVEVRQATTECTASLAIQPGGNANGHVNKKQIKPNGTLSSTAVPANIACYGQGLPIQAAAYSADGMRVVLDRFTSLDSTGIERSIFVRDGMMVLSEFTDAVAPGASAPALAREKRYISGPMGLSAVESTCHFMHYLGILALTGQRIRTKQHKDKAEATPYSGVRSG